MEIRPPEQQRAEDEAEMLGDVPAFVPQRELEHRQRPHDRAVGVVVPHHVEAVEFEPADDEQHQADADQGALAHHEGDDAPPRQAAVAESVGRQVSGHAEFASDPCRTSR
jgi:hypothetical protein